jgi:hypothetical protein
MMHSTVSMSLDPDEIPSRSGGRGVTPRNPKIGIASLRIDMPEEHTATGATE